MVRTETAISRPKISIHNNTETSVAYRYYKYGSTVGNPYYLDRIAIGHCHSWVRGSMRMCRCAPTERVIHLCMPRIGAILVTRFECTRVGSKALGKGHVLARVVRLHLLLHRALPPALHDRIQL